MLNTRQGKDIYTRIFIDCGADINCIDINFAKKHKVNLRKIEKPLKINNVDGSPNDTSAVMSLASWYDSIPFHFRIFSISAPTLTYHDAWN